MKIVIAGAGAVGTHLAKMLSVGNENVVLLDESEEKPHLVLKDAGEILAALKEE